MNNEEYRLIYREAFQDEDTDFEDMLFKFCCEYIIDIKEKGETASMLFALPCKFSSGLDEIKAIYIYAAATKKVYRSKGYMAKLLNRATEENALIFLRPADKSLEKYYSKFAFKSIIGVTDNSECSLVPLEGFKALTELIKPEKTGNKFTLMYYSENEIKADKIEFSYSMN